MARGAVLPVLVALGVATDAIGRAAAGAIGGEVKAAAVIQGAPAFVLRPRAWVFAASSD